MSAALRKPLSAAQLEAMRKPSEATISRVRRAPTCHKRPWCCMTLPCALVGVSGLPVAVDRGRADRLC